MDFLNLQKLINDLSSLLGQVETLKTQLADAEVALQTVKAESFEAGKVVGLEEGKAIGFEEGKVVGYAEGFEAGKKEVPPTDKIYSQAEVDALLEPLKAEIAALGAKVAELEAMPKGFTQEQVDALVAESKVALKLQFDAIVSEYLTNEQVGDDDLKKKVLEI